MAMPSLGAPSIHVCDVFQHRWGDTRRMNIRLRRSLVIPGIAVSGSLIVLGAGAAAALESDTVTSYWRGLWWCLSLMTTVGFLDGAPTSAAGAVLSAALMVMGFLLLALMSAALASLFVREDERPFEAKELGETQALVTQIAALQEQVAALTRLFETKQS
jgi:voltage-gated potassium channel